VYAAILEEEATVIPPDPREESRLSPLAPRPARASSAAPRRLVLDLEPLRRSRDLRLLVLGQGIAYGGSAVSIVALPLQAYRITHSTLVVGLLSLTEFVPLLLASFLGGALADAVDRRRLVLMTQAAACVLTALLVANAALAHPRLWIVFAVAAITTGFGVLQRPTLEAILQRLAEPEELPAIASLTSVQFSIAMVAGPLLGGVVIAGGGLASAYALNAGAGVAALAAFAAMRVVPPAPEKADLSLAAVADGLRYARSRRDLLGTYLVDINALFFGIPEALVPAVAARYGGATVVGVLFAAAPAGALVVSATSGWTGRVQRRGRAVALAATAWGVGIVVFGFAASLPLAVAGLAFAGAADMVSGLFRQTIWNESIPDAIRGRLAGIEMLSYGTGPSLGNVEAGAAASLVGLRASIVAGGVVCILGTAAIALALPALWHYDAATGRRLRDRPPSPGEDAAATPPPAGMPARQPGSSDSTP
jgi:MFS family permease